MTTLIILGAGALGREVAEAVHAMNAAGAPWELTGFLDDAPDAVDATLLPAPVLGTFADAKSHDNASFVLAIATPRRVDVRAGVDARLGLGDDRYATIVHPACSIARSTRIGAGSVLLAGVVTTADVEIGKHVVVMPNTVFTHDTRVGDYATFGAGARLAGRVTVESSAYVGAGALVRESITIGAGALIGMGAVVTRDVPPGEVWAGVPAHRLESP